MKIHVFILSLIAGAQLPINGAAAPSQPSPAVTFMQQLINTLAKGPDDTIAVARSLEIVSCYALHNKSELNKECNGSTPLAWAALYGVHQVVGELCKMNIDPNTTMRSNTTALHAAASRGCLESINILLAHNANVHALTGARQSALHRALLSEHNTVALRLIEAGAPLDIEDNFGNTPLSLAQEKNMLDVVARIQQISNQP